MTKLTIYGILNKKRLGVSMLNKAQRRYRARVGDTLWGCKILGFIPSESNAKTSREELNRFSVRCSCGNIWFPSAYTFLKGTARSCGCYKSQVSRDNFRKDDHWNSFVGSRLGLLHVDAFYRDELGNPMYKVTCTCGEVFDILCNSIHVRKSCSCGCIKSPCVQGSRLFNKIMGGTASVGDWYEKPHLRGIGLTLSEDGIPTGEFYIYDSHNNVIEVGFTTLKDAVVSLRLYNYLLESGS